MIQGIDSLPLSKNGYILVYQWYMPYITPTQSLALREEIANHYADHPVSYFTTKYNVGTSRVYCLASELGVTSNQRWEGEKETVLSMYEAGVPVKAIAKELGHSNQNVTKKLREWGVSLRSLTEGRMQYDFDVNYFKAIDSHEKAYWLGFIYADGNVYLNSEFYKSVFQVALGKDDNGHLLKLKTALKDSRPVYTVPNGERYMINNISFTQDLIALGVTPRKSLTTVFPSESQLPPQYVNSFILGYFDGDGSLSLSPKRWAFSLVGTEPFLLEIQRQFEAQGLPETKMRQEKRTGHGKIFYLTYGGSYYPRDRVTGCEHRRKDSLKKLYGYLYASGCPCLDRKQRAFEQALIKNYGHDWNRT
jgi:hypothetical protein